MSTDKSVGPSYVHHWVLGEVADVISKQLSPSYLKSPSLVLARTGLIFCQEGHSKDPEVILYRLTSLPGVGERDSLLGRRDSSWWRKRGWGSHLELSVSRELSCVNHSFYHPSLVLLLLAFLFLSHRCFQHLVLIPAHDLHFSASSCPLQVAGEWFGESWRRHWIGEHHSCSWASRQSCEVCIYRKKGLPKRVF